MTDAYKYMYVNMIGVTTFLLVSETKTIVKGNGQDVTAVIYRSFPKVWAIQRSWYFSNSDASHSILSQHHPYFGPDLALETLEQLHRKKGKKKVDIKRYCSQYMAYVSPSQVWSVIWRRWNN